MTKAMPFLQKYDITFLRPPTISPAVFCCPSILKDCKEKCPFLLYFHLVQGSRFRDLVAASPPFLEDDILVSQHSPLGNAIKLSGRTFLAPHRGSSPKG